jgi:predicted metal-dependent hydrolase
MLLETNYTITRSKRRTLAIQIGREGQVVVRAPHKLSEAKIQQFIQQKNSWIHKTQSKIQIKRSKEQAQENLFQTGKVVFFGHQIQLSPEESAGSLKDLEIYILKDYLEDRISYFQRLMGLEKVLYKLKFAYYKSRWANCRYQTPRLKLGVKNLPKEVTLSFNIRLVRYPKPVVDYIIVHELCHIFEANHSAKFWKLVADYCPSYRDLKKQLS